ncbi:MAG: hypothetical protein ACE5ES_02625 [Candidatus Nanoarchaeia archaeon]
MRKIDINEKQIGKIDVYLKGQGFDLSENKRINVKNCKHISIERDGLFSLRDHAKPESLDFLYINDIHKTKFYPILIKEMLIYCKIGGFIVLDLKKRGIIDFCEFIKSIKKLVGAKTAIRKENFKERVFVFQKTQGFLEKEDSITRWSFGIISGGNKIDQIDKQIEIIKNLKIPSYEIIICGKYKETKDNKINYIEFDDFGTGWITGKKNVIAENAKYENMVIMHDRIMPNKDFYEGMKKYGNYFEVLSCKVLNDKKERCGDWMTYGNPFNKVSRIGDLDYRDWDKYIWIDGALFIMKKAVWRQVQFDENLFWNQGEDRKMAEDWKDKGIIPRFNPFSSCFTTSWRHGKLPFYKINVKKLGKREISLLHQIKQDVKFYIKSILGMKR